MGTWKVPIFDVGPYLTLSVVSRSNPNWKDLFTELLNLDVPTMIISPDASMYISWSMVGAGQSFTATWEKVAGEIIDIKF